MSLHIIEKHIYQHASKTKRLKEPKEAYSIALFACYLVISIILTDVTLKNILDGVLLLIPLVFHTTLGALSINKPHRKIKENKLIKILLPSSPIIGVLTVYYLNIPFAVNHALLGFVAGALLFIITREIIPKDSKWDPYNFIIGLAVYTIITVSTWLI